MLCQRFARFAPKIAHVVIGEGAVAPTPEGIRLCEETLRENGFNMSEVNCVAWQREFQSRVHGLGGVPARLLGRTNSRLVIGEHAPRLTHRALPCLAAAGVQMTFVAAAELLGVGDEDAVLVSDVDEIPTAAALLEGANLLWNGVGEEGVAIPVVDLRMQAYSLSLYHRVAGPVRAAGPAAGGCSTAVGRWVLSQAASSPLPHATCAEAVQRPDQSRQDVPVPGAPHLLPAKPAHRVAVAGLPAAQGGAQRWRWLCGVARPPEPAAWPLRHADCAQPGGRRDPCDLLFDPRQDPHQARRIQPHRVLKVRRRRRRSALRSRPWARMCPDPRANRRPLNISSMLAEEKDPQGWWMERIDPEADANLLRFSPETRVLLLAHSEALHAVQLAA